MKTGEENNSDRIVSGSIIIATNVAGRGTDLKASDFLVRKGGLHVIITFVPEN
jgi:preprotein translocase subunit SecA